MRAPRVRSHAASAGVPVHCSANHGRATVSTKVSCTSFRHTNDDHSGCSPASIRPTKAHFAVVDTAAATAPATMSTGPASRTVQPSPIVDHRPRSVPTTPSAIAADTIGARSRSSSQQPRATLSLRGGRNVRSSSNVVVARRSRTGGVPSHDEPRLAFFGTAESTATRASRGTDRPAPVIPEFPRNARRPTFDRPIVTRPPPSSYVATIVSSARNAPDAICVSAGMSRTVEISVFRPTRAPSSRSHSGVTSEAYTGKSSVRAASSTRSVVHTCQPIRLRTGCRPSCSPRPSSRTDATTSSA